MSSQTGGKRVRLDAEARRESLLAVARSEFAEHGFHGAGLAGVAERAQVSKTLLYHYFPDGRPELFQILVERLGAELLAEMRAGLSEHDDSIGGLTRRFFGFMLANPDAHRILFLEPETSGEPGVSAAALAIRMRIGIELGTALASAGQPAERTLAGAMAVLGTLEQLAGGLLSGQLEAGAVEAVAAGFLTGGLERVGFVA